METLPVAVKRDAVDQQVDHAGLFTGCQAFPHGVEVGQGCGNLGFVHQIAIEASQFVFDLCKPPLRIDAGTTGSTTRSVCRRKSVGTLGFAQFGVRHPESKGSGFRGVPS